MRWHGIAVALTSLLVSIQAIFSDEAFHVDFHHALLGSPLPHATFFHKPNPSNNASLLYTISDKAVLGAVNPKDGSILWRQLLAGEPVHNASRSFLVAGEKDGQVVSGHDRKVACWDALDGRLVWEHTAPEGTKVGGLQVVSGQQPVTGGLTQDYMILAVAVEPTAHTTVIRVAGDGSGLRWQHVDTSPAHGTSASIAISDDHIYYVTVSHGLLSSNKATITTLDRTTGKEAGSTSAPIESEPLGSDGTFITAGSSSNAFLASADKTYKSLRFSLLSNPKITTVALQDKREGIEDVTVVYPSQAGTIPHFLLHIKDKTRQWAEVYHINVKTAEFKKAYELPATAETSIFAAGNLDGAVFFTRSTETEVSLYSSESHGQLARWTKSNFKTSPGSSKAHATAEIVSRGKASYAVRVAESSSSGDWSLVRNGELQWSRPEMLAYATLAAWDDNSAPDALADELGLEASVNPLTAYIHRLKRHLNDLTGLPSYLQSIPDTILNSSPDADATVRQNLVGIKGIVLGSSRKEVVALNANAPGNVRWQSDLSVHIPDGVEMKSLEVSAGRVSTYLSDGSLIVLNAQNGALIEHQPGTIPVSELIQIPGSPSSVVVKVDADGVPRPATDFAPNTATEGNVIVTLSPDGVAMGWTVGQSVEKTWILKPREGFKIVKIVPRSEHDPVASIGRVLGDRSVLYKYLNPNAALLLATSESKLLMVYVVDAVTGSVLHSATHTGILSLQSVPAVIAENWFAYTFTSRDASTTGLSTQLISSELYESALPNDQGLRSSLPHNYSSFSPDAAAARPHVLSQSFTIAEPISHLSVSQTAQGITSRHLLATLPNSNAIIGIPRDLLDPRRPVERDANATEREEGLVRYSPVLDLNPQWYLTHAREVVGVENVLSSPSLLESTSVVFAFGHDIFGTTITPSMAFDVLGKGFNKAQLVLTVLALGAGVAAVRPLVRRRGIEGRWKA
jgi:ER membrane protein complex subunit 1